MRDCPAVAARRDGMGSVQRKRIWDEMGWDGMPKVCQKDLALSGHLQPPKMPLAAGRGWAEAGAGGKGHVPDAEGERVAGKAGKYHVKALRDVSGPSCPGMGQHSIWIPGHCQIGAARQYLESCCRSWASAHGRGKSQWENQRETSQ